MTMPGLPPMLEVVDLLHRYGGHVAVDHVSLSAAPGEFLTILGESGSGKTTMLRLIAGLEQPTSVARLAIDGQDVSGLPAPKRNCTTVFQSYALFPHLTVGENVAYGLLVRGVPALDAMKAAERALDTVRLSGMAGRRIGQLSGGQRQRAALARSLVTKPAILLLDEPLGALDERLRVDMQSELIELRRQLGMTFIYITHSQEEALSMSDRIILMRGGRIEQSGAPVALFDRPASRFAASFMGFENIVPGTIAEVRGEEVALACADGVLLRGHWTGEGAPQVGAAACLATRAERMTLLAAGEPAAAESNVLPCRGNDRFYRGKYLDHTVETAVGPLKVRVWGRAMPTDAAAVAWRIDDAAVVAG